VIYIERRQKGWQILYRIVNRGRCYSVASGEVKGRSYRLSPTPSRPQVNFEQNSPETDTHHSHTIREET
jgi:hypothetical protein